MSLLEDMRAASVPRRMECSVATVLRRLDDEDREHLLVAFADPTITTTAIAKVLRARGYVVGPDAAQRHRRGACRCPSPTS